MIGKLKGIVNPTKRVYSNPTSPYPTLPYLTVVYLPYPALVIGKLKGIVNPTKRVLEERSKTAFGTRLLTRAQKLLQHVEGYPLSLPCTTYPVFTQ